MVSKFCYFPKISNQWFTWSVEQDKVGFFIDMYCSYIPIHGQLRPSNVKDTKFTNESRSLSFTCKVVSLAKGG